MTDSRAEPDSAGDRRTANVLGALSLAISDRVQHGVAGAADQAPTGAAALSALDQFLRDPTIDLLRQVLGLTSSGTVRLVDRLEKDGLVRREPGSDRRSTVVALTPAGRRAARQVTAARRLVLRDALAALSPQERRVFGELAGRVVASLARPAGVTGWTCRLCDVDACGRPDGRCPVAGPDPPTF